jgi:hypothetical protein
VDVELQVSLARPPTPAEAAALEEAIWAWDRVGVLRGYGDGHLHGLYTDPDFGPRWEGPTLRWLEDFGSADGNAAADALARRLAAWAARWSVPITRLQLGR